MELRDAVENLAMLIERANCGREIVITRGGKPVARLGPVNTAPEHRAGESRKGVTLVPEFEPADARLARVVRNGDVPYRLRELPRR